MKLAVFVVDELPIRGKLTYSREEYSFRFVPDGGQLSAFGTLLIDTLQILVEQDSGRVHSVDGMWPYPRWDHQELQSPLLVEGGLIFVPPATDRFLGGVGFAIDGTESWPTTYDSRSGWICVGDPKARHGIEIATGIGMCLTGETLRSVWLLPKFIGDAP